MLNNINLNLLKYFYEVVNTTNITKASENLLVSQPAISKAIQELENELDVKLLNRSKKGVIPTAEGLILYNHIKEMFDNFNTTLNVIETTKNENKVLYIGSTTTNFLEFIQEPLKKFKEKYPTVYIDIILEKINILSDREKIGKLDIIIKNDYENIKDFCNIKSFYITDKFVASKKQFKELEDKVLTIEELLKYPFVLLSPTAHGRKNFDAFLQSKKIKFKPNYEFNSYSLCRGLIKNGFGIGIGNPINYQNKDFIIINTDFELPKRTFNIGYNKNSNNELIEEFIKLL